MKKMLLPLAALFLLTGCAGADREMEEALAFRSKCLGAGGVSFRAEICADYIDHMEQFTLDCRSDSAGEVTFSVAEPEEISGITGSVSGETGTLTFDDTVLAFPLMAEERLSPVSAPWVMMKALRTGYVSACVREGELLHLTVDDSYDDQALTLEIWIRGEEAVSCEIGWQGRREVTMELEDFTFL